MLNRKHALNIFVVAGSVLFASTIGPILLVLIAISALFRFPKSILLCEIAIALAVLQLASAEIVLLSSFVVFVSLSEISFALVICYLAFSVSIFCPALIHGNFVMLLVLVLSTQLFVSVPSYFVISALRLPLSSQVLVNVINKVLIGMVVFIFLLRFNPFLCVFSIAVAGSLVSGIDTRGSILLISAVTASFSGNLLLDISDLISVFSVGYVAFLLLCLATSGSSNFLVVLTILTAAGLPISILGIGKFLSIALSDGLLALPILLTYLLATFLLVRFLKLSTGLSASASSPG